LLIVELIAAGKEQVQEASRYTLLELARLELHGYIFKELAVGSSVALHLLIFEHDLECKVRLGRNRLLRPELGQVQIFGLLVRLQEHELVDFATLALLFVLLDLFGRPGIGRFLVHGFGHPQSLEVQRGWLVYLHRGLVQDEELEISLHTGKTQ